jgi:ribosomal protein S18 acetylase RimI-like enzyme
MAADLTFSVASPSDASRIQTLLHAAFRADDSRPDWTADPEMNRRFTVDINDLAAKLGDPDTVYLIAPSSAPGNDELTACIGITKITLTRDRPSPVTAARLSNLAIDPSLHRGGLGRRVLEYAEKYSREELGAKVLSLDALSTRTQLIEWYFRRGFRKTGEVVPFPVKVKDGLVLPDDLGFVQFEKELDV